MPKHKRKMMIPFVGRGNFKNYTSTITPRNFKKPQQRNLELEPILENFESEVGSLDAGILKNYYRDHTRITYQLAMLKDEGDLDLLEEKISKEFTPEDKDIILPMDSDGKSMNSPRFGQGEKFFVPKDCSQSRGLISDSPTGKLSYSRTQTTSRQRSSQQMTKQDTRNTGERSSQLMTKQDTRNTGEGYKSLMTKISGPSKGQSIAHNISASPNEMLYSSITTSLHHSKGNSTSDPKNKNRDGSEKVCGSNLMDDTKSNITHLLNPNDITDHRFPPGPVEKKK